MHPRSLVYLILQWVLLPYPLLLQARSLCSTPIAKPCVASPPSLASPNSRSLASASQSSSLTSTVLPVAPLPSLRTSLAPPELIKFTLGGALIEVASPSPAVSPAMLL